MTGGLFDPLGTDRGSPPRRASRLSAPAMVLIVAAVLLVALATVATLKDGGERGTPVAVAPIEHIAPVAHPVPVAHPEPPAIPIPPTVAAGTPTGPAARTDDQVVDVENGVRVIRPRRPAADAPGTAIPVGPGR